MTQTYSGSMPAPGRLHIVDAVKGIAIILMALGHTEQGALHRQLWTAMPNVVRGVTFSNDFIYTFHMPAFFFVSGLFLAGSVERRGKWPFILERARTLLYPYILWELLSFMIDPLTLKFRSAGALPTWQERLGGIVTGNSSWFLITLFATQLLALVLLRLPAWLQMLISVCACLLIPESGITVIYKPFLYLPFVVAGMWFSSDRVRGVANLPKIAAWSGFLVLLVAQLAMTWAWGYVTRWNQIPVGITGIAMLFLLCQGIRGTVAERVLCWYGEASLGIFILASFFQGAGREFVVRALHTTNPATYLAVTTFCAATFPAILWSAQDRLRIGWMFRWPMAKKPAPNYRERHSVTSTL